MSPAMQHEFIASRAAVVTRQSTGDGKDYHPVCVYLLNCAADENGAAIVPALARNALGSTHVVENRKATDRVRSLLERAEQLAQKVNTNELTFSQASFDLEYGN